MKRQTVFGTCVLWIILLHGVLAHQEETPIVMEGSNLATIVGEEFINQTKFDNSEQGYLVFFGAHWCGHCKRFKPQFLNLSNFVIEREGHQHPKFIFYDVPKGDPTIKLFRVSGYPSLIMIKQQKVWKFEGKRNDEEILEWIDKIYSGEHEGKEYPDRPPTFWEELGESTELLKKQITHQFKTNTLTSIFVAGVLLIFVVLIVLGCCALCNDDQDQPSISPELFKPKID